jgi:hypothetical protein
MKVLRFYLLLLVYVYGRPFIWAQVHYGRVSVCHVLKLGMSNRILNVRIDGYVVPNLEHGSVLTDSRCPDGGLYLDASLDDADPSVSAFYQALRRNAGLGIAGKKLSGRFYGKLHLDSKSRKISIVLMRVEDLLITDRFRGHL